MKKNYDAFSKDGRYLFSFVWWPGYGQRRDKSAQEYMNRRYYGNVIARPAV